MKWSVAVTGVELLPGEKCSFLKVFIWSRLLPQEITLLESTKTETYGNGQLTQLKTRTVSLLSMKQEIHLNYLIQLH